MKQKITRLFCIFTIAALGLAACAPIQAQEGQIYVSGKEATLSTVINKRLMDCPIPPGDLAYAVRETYLGIIKNDELWDKIPLTEVAHTGPECGFNDFIRENPENAGWTPIEDNEALKKAKDLLCAEPKTRQLNPKLDESCNAWGRKR